CLWLIACTGCPRKKNSPVHALSSMPRIASSVDFPAPDGPMIDTNSPGWMSPEIRRNTYDRPAAVSNTFSMLRIEISGPTIGVGAASRGAALGALEKNDIGTPKLTRVHQCDRTEQQIPRGACPEERKRRGARDDTTLLSPQRFEPADSR